MTHALIDCGLVHLEDPELRSPGLSKPMRRSYEHIHTPEHIGMGCAMRALAELVAQRNLAARLEAEAEFQKAREDQAKINARFRQNLTRQRNVELYGTRKKPKQAGADQTPRTGAACPLARTKARTAIAVPAALASPSLLADE